MNIDIQYIIIAVNQPDGFLDPSIDLNLLKSAEPSYSMINMYDVITGFEIFNLIKGDGCLS